VRPKLTFVNRRLSRSAGFTTGGLLFVWIVLHLIFFLLTGTKSSGVVRSFFRHLFQLEWKRLISKKQCESSKAKGVSPMPKRSWAASAMPTETFWRRRRDDSTLTRNLK